MLEDFRKVYEILNVKGDAKFVKFALIEDPVKIEIIPGEIELLNNIKITNELNDSIILITRVSLCDIRQYEDHMILTINTGENYVFTDYNN